MNKSHFNTILLIVFLILSTTTLFYARAQQEHFFTPATIISFDFDEWNRGESYQTGAIFEKATWDDQSGIWMDAQTALTLLENREELAWRFDQGRIVVRGEKMHLHIRDLDIVVNGTATLVHYSWLNQVSIFPIEGTIDVFNGEDFLFSLSQATSLLTLSPYSHEPTEFALDAPSCHDFYTFSGLIEKTSAE